MIKIEHYTEEENEVFFDLSDKRDKDLLSNEEVGQLLGGN